jgi:hypothetical protein
MTVLMVSEWQGNTDDYDRTLERVMAEVPPDDQCSMHVMAVTGDDSFTVTEVWSNRAACEQWFERAMPTIEGTVGNRHKSWKVYDVHNLMTAESGREQGAEATAEQASPVTV